MPVRVRRIEIQGFRGFGTSRQSITLPDTVAVIWGGNSQGKTSLAEAVEFLLTGQIARRELLASSKDEYSQSLRNAHIPTNCAVYVEAEFVCHDGVARTLRRILTADYDGADSCKSTLQIDGTACHEEDIEKKIGLKLLHPPLRAPILAQHTLAYVFSASPTERAAYFRAVLDTQDLEDFRTAVAALAGELPEPTDPLLDDLDAVSKIENLKDKAEAIASAKNKAALDAAMSEAVTALIGIVGQTPENTHPKRVAQIVAALEERRKLTFPLELFARKPFAGWTDPTASVAALAATFETERKAVDAETRRLVSLYQSVLAIPAIAKCDAPMGCPVCGTDKALTPDRVAHIRDQVANNKSYQEAEKALAQELRSLDGKVKALADSSSQALPKFAQSSIAERRMAGFGVERIADLSGDVDATALWFQHAAKVWRRTRDLKGRASALRDLIKDALEDLGQWQGLPGLKSALAALNTAEGDLVQAHQDYTSPAQALGGLIKAVVDLSSNTQGWEELINLANNPAALLNALNARRSHGDQLKELEKALRQIDTANGRVADEKFADLSGEVTNWWERLRPGERTYFSSVRRRSAKARRTVDVKVSMSAADDRSSPKLRDAVAVFSQSQLHCLGLSLFLARVIDGKVGFVLLDDPVLTSDDDFRPNFSSTVIEALLAADIQIIVVTQCNASWKDIGHRWEHKGVAQFQMIRDDPVLGTEIRSQTDALATLLAQAQPYIHSQDGDSRKNGATKIRQGIERFSKEILVRSRQAGGDALASITDYDGQNFGNFSNSVKALLIKDPSHPGKLQAAHNYVTPGPHDDTPPSTAQLKVALGDLKKLKKEYLG
ncbi:AAA family ATPase [Rhodopseudomonas sp. P1]|uniref:AAA family ATPase n=1 Tax=Rhodopseudomonas sp. P1 TaxID=3434357 RepID=UPI0031FC7041